MRPLSDQLRDRRTILRLVLLNFLWKAKMVKNANLYSKVYNDIFRAHR